MAVVSSLFVYPIKSCRGISLERMEFGRRGPVNDRHWMLVDTDGRFITQRENPKLALLQPRIAERLHVSVEGANEFTVPEKAQSKRNVSVWGFRGEADDLGNECARWFSTAIGQECRLVRFRDDVVRKTSQRHTQAQSEVAFADGYPALLISLESLSELNRKLAEPVSMNRFRPNIVVRDVQPFAEDRWKTVVAPEIALQVVKPCERCVITTVDQQTGQKGREPLKTLATFRLKNGKVVFGQNCLHLSNGYLSVGDPLTPS